MPNRKNSQERRRSRNEIRIAILRFCKHDFKKSTHIQYFTNTWQKILKKDLAYLEKKGLIESQLFGRYPRYKTTKDGLAVLNEWNLLRSFLYDEPAATKRAKDLSN